ncbi:DUF1853 family protein [Sulfuriferula thiophila]|uniref:DUF1853 family protein n=1 Tax=Sulfuriferula thiophila TaxID=1781211 RepID=UPI000F60BF41|nr:DUF1853 family protein [Sulfuriferula thiophila]
MLTRFQNAQVRDLVWVMAAPGLLENADWVISDDECQQLLNQAMPQLQALDSQPDALHAWIAARNPQRLGPYFEVLLGYWITHLIDASWFAANQIVKAERIVTGEYDMLWRDAGGQINHWEAAVKFYLQIDQTAGLAGYVGTMTRDRLDLKTARLRDKQLQLSTTPAGAAALDNILPVENQSHPVRARALLKGWLFYPRNVPHPLTDGLSPIHLSGWWARWAAHDFSLPANLHWRVLDRLAWLSPVIAADTVNLLTEAEFMGSLSTHFAAEGAPLLVVGLSQNSHGWQEMTRGFIVPLMWGAGHSST